jgi:hypothetical protein
MSSKNRTPSFISAVHTLQGAISATPLILLGRNTIVSSTTILALLLGRSTRVHLLVHARIEDWLLRVVRLLSLLLRLRGEELVLWLLLLLLRRLRDVSLLLCSGLWLGIVGPALVLWRRILSWYNVDQEVEHVGLAQCSGDVAALQSPALVLLSDDPGAHGQFGDEGLAGFGEDYRRLGGDHLDFWIGLHDFLDTGKRELVDLVVVVFRLERSDDLLPISVEDVASAGIKAL